MNNECHAKTVLVTGGAGYIGSHIVVELLQLGYKVVVIDSLVNSSEIALDRVADITNKKAVFYKADIRDKEKLQTIFKDENIDGVIHMAGLKAVGESVSLPLKYFNANINGFITLAEVMEEYNVHNLVFSSSATVYGDPETVPVDEKAALSATNPYGRCKLIIEEMIQDMSIANKELRALSLRYFNPVGAHNSGLIGEDPAGIPNNLFPYIAQVAVGKREKLSVFGGDYETHDGTGIRDYIHVCDLAKGHVQALKYIFNLDKGVCEAINLGTGNGYSVLEAVSAWRRATNREIAYKIVERRAGDVAENYANAKKAKDMLEWEASLNLNDMCASHWHWQHGNPNGYSQ